MEDIDASTLQPPPQQPEPEPKKPKLSDDPNVPSRKQKYKRRKIAIFFGYCGVGYQGMQKNPGAKTIEGELEEALFLAGAVPEQDRGFPNRYDWSRSARTDKGVSAVGQVVSARFYIDPPGLVHRLNSILPSQIRIFGYKRATASFSSKKFCDRRRYVYLIPVFALDPSCHSGTESVIELGKCLECSQKGHKFVGKSSFDSKVPVDSVLSCESKVGCAIVDTNVHDSNSESIKEPNVGDATASSVQNEGSESLDGLQEKTVEEEKAVKRSPFCYGDKEKEMFNRVLNSYVGCHNFHNFTSRTKAEDPAARRYILSFDASNTVTVDGIDFVKCEVVGQSFMLHQIRKMVGLAVAIMRGCAPESFIETALRKDVNINVPTAPEVGLYLDECLFSSYNNKWKDSHGELSMKDYAEEAEDFKIKHIYSHISASEQKDGVVGLWLHSLNHRNYPDLCLYNDASGTITDSKRDKGEETAKDSASDHLDNITEHLKTDEVEKIVE